jgi:DNA-binding CsgD family transcriptional regulator
VGFLHGDARVSGRCLAEVDFDALGIFAVAFPAVYELAVLRHRLRTQRQEMRQVAVWADTRTGELSDRAVTLNPDTDNGASRGNELAPPMADLLDRLTRREYDVLRLMADGESNASIAQHLFVSVGTVKFHVKNIFRKMGVSSRSELVAQYLRTTVGDKDRLLKIAQGAADGAGLLGHGGELGYAVLVGGGAGEHVQVGAAELGDGRVLTPVAVVGVGLADLGRVALERRDPGGDGLLGRLRRLPVLFEEFRRGRAGARLGQPGALGAEPGLLAQGVRYLRLLRGQRRGGGRLVEQAVPADLGGSDRADGVLRPTDQRSGAGVEAAISEGDAPNRAARRNPAALRPRGDGTSADDDGGDQHDRLGEQQRVAPGG